MWFSGAGASAAAGIPTAWDMIWEFKQQLFISQRRVSPQTVAYLSNPAVRAQLQAHIDASGNLPSQREQTTNMPASSKPFTLRKQIRALTWMPKVTKFTSTWVPMTSNDSASRVGALVRAATELLIDAAGSASQTKIMGP